MAFESFTQGARQGIYKAADAVVNARIEGVELFEGALGLHLDKSL
jgi:hypothetical protein